MSEPFQIAETLYSVTLAWDYSPTPVHLPLLGYNITLRSCDHSHDKEVAIVTSGNETELILFDLSPGTSYCVTASGWNLMGHGPASSVVRVTTMSAVVPPAPTHLRQRHRQRGQLNVTWQVNLNNGVHELTLPPTVYYYPVCACTVGTYLLRIPGSL